MKHWRTLLTQQLINFFDTDLRRIEHALEVLEETLKLIHDYPEADLQVAVAAALLHDAGIRPSEALYGMNNGRTQEELGPAEAEKILKRIGFPSEKSKIVCEIISNHHSPSRYPYCELELLKAADLIVNRRNRD